MDNAQLQEQFRTLSTPLLADACLRLQLPMRLAPPGIRPLIPTKFAGRALPVQHFGSVDIFMEALEAAQTGDVMVIDNANRQDEACIGDLTVLEVQLAGLQGIVLWGYHRDTAELLEIGFPVFSCGAYPAGPRRLDNRTPDALTVARMDDLAVRREDIVFADLDGVLFVQADQVEQVLAAAVVIWERERRQAEAIRGGKSLRDQLHFRDYLKSRAENPAYSLREHLTKIGGAIEV